MATTTSSQNVNVDLTYWDGNYQPPDIRPCEHCPQAPGAEGAPVSLVHGNVFFDQADGSVGGLGTTLSFVRSYNSANRGNGLYGTFGLGWHHNFERSLGVVTSGVIMMRRANGVPRYFSDPDGDNRFDATVPFMLDSWIEKQPDGSFLRRLHDGGLEEYDVNGRLLRIVDPSGNATVLNYAGTQVTTITAPGGRALTLGYASGRLTTLSGSAGLIATYGYDGSGRLASVVYADAAGSGYTFAYDAATNGLTTVSDQSGRKVETHAYDGAGRGYTSEIAAGQEKLTFTFQDGLTLVTDALGNVTTYEHKWVWGQRLVTRITGACLSCGGGLESQEWTYDNRGRVRTHGDAEGKVTTYTYDAGMGHVESVTESAGTLSRTTAYTYASNGRVETVTATDRGQMSYVQGVAGPTSATDAIGRTTTMTYTNRGQIETVINPRLKTTTFVYDLATGDLTSVRNPLNHTTEFGYDAHGRRNRIKDPLGNETTYTYDTAEDDDLRTRRLRPRSQGDLSRRRCALRGVHVLAERPAEDAPRQEGHRHDVQL